MRAFLATGGWAIAGAIGAVAAAVLLLGRLAARLRGLPGRMRHKAQVRRSQREYMAMLERMLGN